MGGSHQGLLTNSGNSFCKTGLLALLPPSSGSVVSLRVLLHELACIGTRSQTGMSLLALAYLAPVSFQTVACALPEGQSCTAIYADIHDGDKKKVTIGSGHLTIEPYDNQEKWIVKAALDTTHCNASIDFRVAGKPNPPPSALTATYVVGTTAGPGPLGPLPPGGAARNSFGEVVFTDPTGALGGGLPLNVWVLVNATLAGAGSVAPRMKRMCGAM